MENLSWVIAAIGALVGGPIMVFGVRNSGQKPAGFDQIVGALKQDWIRTGNIDFHASALESSSPQPLRLRVEEKRVIESVAGQDIVELRWRLATLAEGKELVVCWNAKQIDRISNPWETNQLDCRVGADTAGLEQATIP
jgi:hypothetical protein